MTCPQVFRNQPRSVFAACLLTAALAGGCASLPPCPVVSRVAEFPPAEIDSILFLIGDAGEAAQSGEPVLLALRSALRRTVDTHGPEKVLAAFLGDNIYPSGLPSPESRGFARAQRKLDAQIDVFAGFPEELARPLGVFVPGNHDWDHRDRDGTERVLRQQARLAERGEGRVDLLPGEGCPGPAVVDVGGRLRLLALDTQWWFRRDGNRPADGCDAGTESAVSELLASRLRDAGSRHAVVIGHHPFRSGGPHGGESNFLRGLGLIPQDISSSRYRRMIAGIESAFDGSPPLAYAAGHEHSLQLLGDGRLPYLVVSGSGSEEKLTGVGALGDTVFCREASGFVRLDFARDGRVRFAALIADPPATGGTEVFSTWLEHSSGC